MGHGIARLSPNFCCDKMRFWSIGQSEAAVWDDLIFQQNDPHYLTTPNSQTVGSKSHMNERLRAYGLPVEACQNLLNPGATSFLISNAKAMGLLYRLIILVDAFQNHVLLALKRHPSMYVINLQPYSLCLWTGLSASLCFSFGRDRRHFKLWNSPQLGVESHSSRTIRDLGRLS